MGSQSERSSKKSIKKFKERKRVVDHTSVNMAQKSKFSGAPSKQVNMKPTKIELLRESNEKNKKWKNADLPMAGEQAMIGNLLFKDQVMDS